MVHSESSFKPLEGVRVLEVTHMVMGPSCGMILAALGAEVIKLEPPGGDKTRQLGGMGTAFFPLFNRGKQSVCIDFGSAEGQERLHDLLESSDVLLENFRNKTLCKLGLDSGRLRKYYPDLIISSCKGFLSGPYEDRPAMDEVVQMMSGMAYMTGPAGRPLRAGTSVNDIMGGLFAALGVLAALIERRKTGKGRTVKAGLFETSVFLMGQHMVQYALSGVEPNPMPERDFSWPVYDTFACKDEAMIFVGSITESHWQELCKCLDLEQLLEDERLQNVNDRIAARSWTLDLIAGKIRQKPIDAWVTILEEKQIPFSRVLRPAQLYADPHVIGQGGLSVSHDSNGKEFLAPALPIEIDGGPNDMNFDVPQLGQHTSDVFSNLPKYENRTVKVS